MRTLFLAPRVPYPPNRGDRIRSWRLLQYFAQRGPVDLACTTDEPISRDQRKVLVALCERLAIVAAPTPRWWSAIRSLAAGRSASEGVYCSAGLRQTLLEWRDSSHYDVVFAYCSSMTPYLETLQINRDRVLIDLVDVDSGKWQDYADRSRGVRSAVYRLEKHRVVQLERRAAALSRRLLVTTDSEAQAAIAICPEAVVSVLRNGVDLDYFGLIPPLDAAASLRPTCVFTGVLDYRPNVQAVHWFVDEVWDSVRSRFPAARFLIVGRNPTPAVCRLAAKPGVELRPDVADVRPSLAESQVVVAPLQIARGIQNKILEGMAARRAVVASPQAATGLDAIAGTELLVAEDPTSWVTAVTRLFDNVRERDCLAAAGRRYVEQNHHWDEQLQLLDHWLDAPKRDAIPHEHRPAKAAF